MSKHTCNLYVSIPNYTYEGFLDSPHIKWIRETFLKHEVEMHKYDTLPGWWNLNQDWYMFKDIEVDIGWSSIEPLIFSDEEAETFEGHLRDGKLIMMVYYVNLDGTETPLT